MVESNIVIPQIIYSIMCRIELMCKVSFFYLKVHITFLGSSTITFMESEGRYYFPS